MNSVKAGQSPHIFSYNGWEVRTSGNPLTHCILRGAVNKYGQNIPNYHYEDLIKVADTYIERAFANPTIIVDTNHANSNKAYNEQPRISLEVVNSMRQSETLKDMVKGLMIESFIEEGSQDISGNVFGKSITDPCLGWGETEKLVIKLASVL